MLNTNLNQEYIAEGQAGGEVLFNEFMEKLSAIYTSVLSVSNSGTATNGNAYVVGSTPTGDFVGHEDEIAVYYSRWLFTPPKEGMKLFVSSTSSWQRFAAGVWAAL